MYRLFIALALSVLPAVPGTASAHSAVFDCFDNGDGTVTCQGGFSDGSSASGVKVVVRDGKGGVVEELKLNADSEISFKKPAGDYSVTMDGGEGHSVVVDGGNIVE